MSAEAITITTDGPLAIVTLNRPESYNATDFELHSRLATVWGDVEALPGIRAVVLTGAGDAFSAGGDLRFLEQLVADRSLRSAVMAEAAAIIRAIVDLPIPLIAAVNGPAVGLGCSLAGLADFVVMEEDAYLADPHVSLGLVAGDGSVLTWPLHLGLQRSKEWILLGGRISADEALRMGLANRVVPPGEALAEAMTLATAVAALPPQAVRETLAALDAPLRANIDESLDSICEAEERSFDEPRFQENLARMLARMSR
ncbi:MAG: enoyl-CoA hydratase/isomerase family protein [Microbacterium sp.]